MKNTDVVVVGAGSIGVACAYYIKRYAPELRVILADSHAPLSFTSAHSGENYRNWWPHPTMKRFIDRSLDLVEAVESESGTSVRQNTRGYLLCTALSHPDDLLNNLDSTFADAMRFHQSKNTFNTGLTDGVDIIEGRDAIRSLYPHLSDYARTLIHIRRGGALDTQQLASLMLDTFKAAGGERLRGKVSGISYGDHFDVEMFNDGDTMAVRSACLVNAAGPFSKALSDMLSVDLPLENVLQQKVSFEDKAGVVPRDLPFTIDLDDIELNWTDEEAALLSADENMQRFTGTMPGSIHCRPEGNGQWVKLGWAYNETAGTAIREPRLDNEFPEIVLRAASRMHPQLMRYLGSFPGGFVHYGGYYTMTGENWPLIGETSVPGYLIASGMSGFGSMAACATGDLIASLITGRSVADYSNDLSLGRYDNTQLMMELAELGDKGLL